MLSAQVRINILSNPNPLKQDTCLWQHNCAILLSVYIQSWRGWRSGTEAVYRQNAGVWFFFQPNSELRTWMFRDIKQYTYNMTLIKSVKSEWRILYALVQGPHGFVVSCDPSEEKSDPWGISEKTVPVCAFFFRKQHGVYLIYLWKCSKCQEWGCFLHLLHYMPQYLRESWTMVTNRKFWWIEPNLLKTFHYWWLDTEDGRKDFWIMFFKGEKKKGGGGGWILSS